MILRDYYQANVPTLLFSLHRQPAAAIATGTKLLEYRRQFFTQPFQALVYVTGPGGGVAMYLQAGAAVVATPTILGAIGAAIQNDQPAEVARYLQGRDRGCAIPITAVTTINNLALPRLRQRFTNFVTPRGYVYLDQPARQAQLRFFLDQPCAPLRTNRELTAQLNQLKSVYQI